MKQYTWFILKYILLLRRYTYFSDSLGDFLGSLPFLLNTLDGLMFDFLEYYYAQDLIFLL